MSLQKKVFSQSRWLGPTRQRVVLCALSHHKRAIKICRAANSSWAASASTPCTHDATPFNVVIDSPLFLSTFSFQKPKKESRYIGRVWDRVRYAYPRKTPDNPAERLALLALISTACKGKTPDLNCVDKNRRSGRGAALRLSRSRLSYSRSQTCPNFQPNEIRSEIYGFGAVRLI